MQNPLRRIESGPLRTAVWAFGIVIGLVVIIGTVAAFTLFSISRDLRHAKSMIDSAGVEIEDGRLTEARGHLLGAEKILISANGRLYGQPQFDLVSWAPGVDQNLSSLRRSVALALQLVRGGRELLDLTRPFENQQGKLEVSMRHGAIPLATVQAVERQSRDLAVLLPATGDEPGASLLAGPVADLQHKVFREAGRRRNQLDNVSRALSLLSDMAGGNGSRRYLIAVANTAEMRGAGGMVLSYGILESNNGTFTLGEFGNIDELLLDAPVDPASLNLPADYLARWAGLQPTELWRNTTLAPDFRFDAPVMRAMFTAKTKLPVDGVIQVDPAGLSAILTGTGPVAVDEVGQVTAENVVDLTVNRAYIDFPRRDQRQEILGDVARSVFDALVNGDFASLRPFGDALFDAALSRHLIFSPSDPDAAADTAFFGADGALPDPGTSDYALLTVQNFSKNKLDYYVDTSLDLSGTRPDKDSGDLLATITVTNAVPSTVVSSYVMGPNAPGEVAGLYRGAVSLYVPNGTSLVEAGGSTRPPVLTTEAGRTVVSFDVVLRPGETSTVQLRLGLVPRPNGPYSLLLVPVPRVRPTVVSVTIDDGSAGGAIRPAAPLTVPSVVKGAG